MVHDVVCCDIREPKEVPLAVYKEDGERVVVGRAVVSGDLEIQEATLDDHISGALPSIIKNDLYSIIPTGATGVSDIHGS